jgi:hypothetical protein
MKVVVAPVPRPVDDLLVVQLTSMATVLKWNGKDVPEELRKLPEGRYVIESLDALPALTPEEEQGLEESLDALDRGEGADLEILRTDLEALVRR